MKMNLVSLTRRLNEVGKYKIEMVCEPSEELDDYLLKLEKKLRNGQVVVEMKTPRKERSVNANKLMWALCDDIAKAIRSTRILVYREAIKDVAEPIEITVPKNEYSALEETWSNNGIGWFVIPYQDKGGEIVCWAYSGSSVFDTQQMSRLIDHLLFEAKELGIQVPTNIEYERG